MPPSAVSLELPAEPPSVGDARSFVRTTLCDGDGSAECLDTAMLLVSELVSNAVRHGRGMVTVEVVESEAWLRIMVGDDGDDLPRLQPVDHEAEDGRGLWLVEALADGWGIETRVCGKHVWFELATRVID